MNRSVLESPVGPLTISETDGAITAISWGHRHTATRASVLLRRAVEQLIGYFAGELHSFDLPMAPAATPFQRRLRQIMLQIPFGCARSYGALAHELGSGPRAVGMGCGANTIPLLVPCHRVLAAHGLGGYSGGHGLATKRQLLALEGFPLPD